MYILLGYDDRWKTDFTYQYPNISSTSALIVEQNGRQKIGMIFFCIIWGFSSKKNFHNKKSKY